MTDEWYYSCDREQHGPVTRATLGELAEAGELRPSDLVWKDGMAEWAAAFRVRGLFPEGSPPNLQHSNVELDTTWPYESKLWHILAIVSSVIFVVSYFIPWWEFSVDFSRAQGKFTPQSAMEFNSVMKESSDWLKSCEGDQGNLGDRVTSSILESPDAKVITFRVWGRQTFPGVLALIAGILAAASSTTALALRSYRRWSWIGLCVDAVLALAILVLATIFLASAPTHEISILNQSLSVGLYLGLLGGLAMLIAGIAGGVVGILAFRRGRNAASV